MNLKITKKMKLKPVYIIDLLFLMMAFGFVLFVYLVFKREQTLIEVKFKVAEEDPLYQYASPNNEYADSFIVGDVQKSDMGETLAEIEKVESYKLDQYTRAVYLNIKIKATYNPQKNQYSFRGKPIIYGESHSFSFSKVKFRGLVIDFPGFKNPEMIKQTTTIVRAQLRNDSRDFSDIYGVPDFIAKSVKVGDEIKDTSGATKAKVLKVEIKPASRTVQNNGLMRIVNDPYLKDVYYEISLNTTEIGGNIYMFDYIPVTIGQDVPLNFNNVSIFPTIIEVFDTTL